MESVVNQHSVKRKPNVICVTYITGKLNSSYVTFVADIYRARSASFSATVTQRGNMQRNVQLCTTYVLYVRSCILEYIIIMAGYFHKYHGSREAKR